ncbi:glycosyltransferase family 2 protein [Candidatus Woesebacteria bacterium]|nr:glycosyltransferase family 2 protein [Candidatus Woesebacteria bacterium]
MDVSVVIVSFNTEEVLVNCLKSLKIALNDLTAEVFVVDNNSEDETVVVVKKDFPQVMLVANHNNVGFSRANNQALKVAKGKYVLILNPDTEVYPDTIEKMTGFLKDHSDTAIATCRVQLPDGQLDRDCRRHFPTPWRAFTHFSGLSKIFKGSKIFDQYYMGYLPDTKEHEVDSIVGAFMMIRKKDLDKIGFFDEDFFFYGEDLDLCWRARHMGYKVFYTPITKILHYKGVASGMKPATRHLSRANRQSKKRALAQSVRAMQLFYQKHYQSKYPFFINWPVLLSLMILKIIRVTRA